MYQIKEHKIKVGNTDLQDFAARIEPFGTYEDFLKSRIREKDANYLEDIQVAMALVEIGALGGPCDGCTTGLFGSVKYTEWEKKRLARSTGTQVTALSQGRVYDNVMLKALQHREEANRMGKMASIFYIRCLNEKGQEVSGYVDYAHRLSTESFEAIFDGTKKFMPKTTDLSYVNWATMAVCSKNSTNYEVIAQSAGGMVFKNTRDKKIINVDPNAKFIGDTTWRIVKEKNPDYISIIIYDHINKN